MESAMTCGYRQNGKRVQTERHVTVIECYFLVVSWGFCALVKYTKQHYHIIAKSTLQRPSSGSIQAKFPTWLHLLHRLGFGLLHGPAVSVGEDKRLVGGQHQPLPLRLQRRVLWQRPPPEEVPLLHLVRLLLTCGLLMMMAGHFHSASVCKTLLILYGSVC